MQIRSYILYILMGCLLFTACNSTKSKDEKIRSAVERQMELYPHSTLRDLYKNFFQDRYGPGHIIANSTAADNYLRSELESATSFEGEDYEPAGYEGRFYRVNLGVIADGRVPYDIYFDAFLRSVNGIKPTPIELWRCEWQHIDSIITAMGIELEDMASDRKAIAETIDGGEYVMHHSRQFNQHYQPHYRIIERTIFENEILPLLNK